MPLKTQHSNVWTCINKKFKTKENSDSGLCYYSIEASNNKKLS